MDASKLPRKKIIAVVAVLLGLALAVAGFKLSGRQDVKQSVQTDPVKVDQRVIAEGYVTPVKASGLNFAMAGLISEVLVAEGDEVKEGQVLARLDDRELQAKYKQAQAELAKNQSNLSLVRSGSREQEVEQRIAETEAAQADFETVQKDYQRKQKLFAESAISQQETDQAATAYKKANSALKSATNALELAREGNRAETVEMAMADLASAQASMKYYESQLTQTELKAPFSGTVMFINFNVGEYAVTGSTNLLDAGVSTNSTIKLADLSRWQVKTEDLNEMDINKVKPGATATVKFDAIPGLEMKGRVVQVRAYGERKHGDMTYSVTINLDGNDPRLRWNMKATVAIDC